MPSINLSPIDVGGPCKLSDNGTVIYFEKGVKIIPVPKFRGIPKSIVDEDDDTLVDLYYQIKGQPKAIWNSTYRGVLLPSALLNMSVGGTPIVGTANRTVSIIGANGQGRDFVRGKLVQPPSVFFGLGEDTYGEAVWECYIGTGKSLSDAGAFFTLNTTAWSQSDYPTGHLEEVATAAYGALTGFDAIFAEKGFKLTHSLSTRPLLQGNLTVDRVVKGYRGMIDFIPQEPTIAQIEAAMATYGGVGTRSSTNAFDLVVSSANASMTLKSASLQKGEYNYDLDSNRIGGLQFKSALATPGTRLAFT